MSSKRRVSSDSNPDEELIQDYLITVSFSTPYGFTRKRVIVM